VVRGHLVITDDGTDHPTYTWAWDQFVNGLPEGAVQDLSIYQHDNVRLLRAALQARGVWETDLANQHATASTYLRLFPTDTRRRLPTPIAGATTNGEATPPRWDASPDIVVDTSGQAWPSPPTEADIVTLLDRPEAKRAGPVASLVLGNRTPKVHVLVHHRWSQAAAPADIRVLLMRHAMPDDGNVPLGGLWAALVTAVGSASPPASLPGGWAQASTVLWKSPAGPIDARMPRAVSFDLDLSADPDGNVMLLAVVMSASNQIGPADLRAGLPADATNVQDLVLRSPHAAARSVELT